LHCLQASEFDAHVLKRFLSRFAVRDVINEGTSVQKYHRQLRITAAN